MGAAESKGGTDTIWGCCETRTAKGVPRTENISSRLCGVGMGLDSQLLAANRGAVVTCLAKGGPADQAGSVQIGDTLVFVDDLDVRELMNNPHSGKYDVSRGISTVLANALLGEAGTTVRLGLIRGDETKIVYRDLKRAPLKPGCQWISAPSNPSAN
mmetsp:Transcript_17801/g.37550  ORF Transcript_17801/g.37550 Transcript_17801/m.37550 type:complete len:157 (-) Transcript_17801:45-515(-)